MARYQIILSYDGTDFQGFQRQGSKRTVQGEVEQALRRLGWCGRSILAAGRTDSGVHAAGQVIAFDLDWQHTPDALARALDSALPHGIAVQSAALAGEDFHPRYDARARQYRYEIYCRPVVDPLRDRYAWRVYPALDGDLLRQAAALLTGARDYAALGKPPKPGGSTMRIVYSSEWTQTADGWRYRVSANAFLYHMVRRMVYLQVRVGQGRLTTARLVEVLDQEVVPPPGLAPASGLCLEEVRYQISEKEIRMLTGEVNWNEL
ncbi:MAG: tRNA pseudouridine(38-40) synthase TruA [Anaerolineae bacterium]|nr:tRNA pseudouridine(38-40) synthase TruA [Anaerolineae bacterium]